MTLPRVEFSIIDPRKLSPSQPNSVIIIVNTKSEEIFINQTTGHRTHRSTPVSPPYLININLRSSSHDYIRSLLHDRFLSYRWLYNILAPAISTAAIDLGFGYNGFTFTMDVTVTYHYQAVSVTSNDEKSLRMVLLGGMKAEELNSLKMETESCSICLVNLSGSKPSELTRMTCSHVFHSHCLLEWLKRKNTCPLCRTVLYDR